MVNEQKCLAGHRYNLLEEATFTCVDCDAVLDGGTLEKLSVADGDVLVVTFPPDLPSRDVRQLHETMEQMLYKIGKKAAVLTLPEGVMLSQLSNGEKAMLLKTLSTSEVPSPVEH